MFEYLMPSLVMRSYPNTVLDQTLLGAVRRQRAYAAARDVPWGVSESAYNLRDRHLTYQYRAFGVPDLALKRGLGRDLVIAPYATALAAMVDPIAALENFAALERLGALGPYGFRDALDYTRPTPGARYALVHAYMAHHIGMSLVALANLLTGDRWPERFHADPAVRAVELLLQERIPRRVTFRGASPEEVEETPTAPLVEQPAVRVFETPDTPQPRVALLGHLPYTVMVDNRGSGYGRYHALAVTRWRPDATTDGTGQSCYVKDLASGRVWSTAHQPMCAPYDRYRVELATDRASFQRLDGEIETRTEITAVPSDAAEVRRVTVTNHGSTPREVELTSYAEVVLAPPAAATAHPAFANLFVETEWHEWCSALFASRRPRSADEPRVWGVHVAAVEGDRHGVVSYETDRARFLGRGRSTRDPAALDAAADGPLEGVVGAVLDPIVALRARLTLAPGASGTVAFTTLVAETRERAFELADRYDDPAAAQRALDLAWTTAQVELRELDIAPADAALFQDFAGHLLFADRSLGAPAAERARHRGSQPLLWAAGISGDWPILLASIDSPDGLPTLRQLLAAHRYWRRRGVQVDLVILDTHPPTYLRDHRDRIDAVLAASPEGAVLDQPGGVFVRRADLLAADTLLMLRATARVHVVCDGAPLGRTLDRLAAAELEPSEAEAVLPTLRRSERSSAPVARTLARLGARLLGSRAPHANGADALEDEVEPTAVAVAAPPALDEVPSADLLLDNGIGGLTVEGDYEIRLTGDALPPAPWVNVIANPRAGLVVSERGAGASWVDSSYFYRLTPWHNDPVSDPISDVLYLQDEEDGTLWSATPAPIRHASPYVVRHGPGTTCFEHEHQGIATRLTIGVPTDDPVKLSLLEVTNHDVRPRHLAVTAYAEWTLGVLREHTRHQVQTSFDAARRAVIARNTFDERFADHTAFCAMSEPLAGHTADRREFLGRNGTTAAPAALVPGSALSGRTGAGVDPCAALQCQLVLAPGETRTVCVALGAGASDGEAMRLAERYGNAAHARAAIGRAVAAWRDRLSVVTVRTPEPAFDAMVNRWTLYQTLACRVWARTALYQSSGAYGFRDQLQDAMALLHAAPALARAHILRAAARQFVEGDVQHWWHPHSGRGVRTRFSDDLAWLPFVVDHYVTVTGDASVLDEQVPFLAAAPLAPEEHERYDLPTESDERGTVYEHCRRALTRACTVGAHGLPLIGIGDWNDGMSRVGVAGQGESVWLAWFLIATLRGFAARADARGDDALAAELRGHADGYAAAVETHGWDGAWYRRAYFDDGTPLGTASDDECRIDAIAQSWSVISGAGDAERQAVAMRSVETHLVREDARLLMLLTPPFDRTPRDPGYIKGYLPGVRENGAQYTHAALWTVLATALRGDGDRAFDLFQMLNPLTHARTPAEVATYKVEPYVVAADVYTADGQLGRGGWTWYTGSASWMYRVALETILGFTRRGDALRIDPRVPAAWTGYAIDYRHGTSTYRIAVELRDEGADEVVMDGAALPEGLVPLRDDGVAHEVRVRVARGEAR
ncbi:MAG TPA: glucoamylase family protein [Gemmatimonadaceae bacterium]|nr:glucoamylase family protein [Gemmatimonadaceae bacterium]